MSRRPYPSINEKPGSFPSLQKLPGSKYIIFAFALLLSFQFVSAQVTNRVQGKVTSGDTSLPNVTVQVKGVKTATQTDNNGNFSILAAPNATLVITAVGYNDVEVKVNNRSTIAVQMESAARQLEQVVVVGYGTQKKKDLTGSVSSVTAETIAKVPVTSIDQALQGRASGVQVTNNDGAPGNSVTVVIRGVGSLGNNDPLYVVDGYPIQGGLNNINPSDIATIDVLKDASATAIYGVRAASGVVIITTKRGGKNGVQVSLDAYTSVQSRPKTYKVLNAGQWATLANEDARLEGGFTPLPEWANPASLRNVDWQDAMYRKGLKQNYNIAIRGGNDKVQSSFSAGYYNQKGIVLGSYFKRANLGLNIDYQVNKWLKSSSSAKYSRQDSNNPFGTGSLSTLSELIPTITGNKLTDQIKDANGNYGFFNPVNIYTKSWNNPVYTVENNDYKNLSNYILASTSLEATILDGLKIKTNLGVNSSDFSGYYFQPTDERSNQQYGLGGPNQNSVYSQNASNSFDWLWENTLSYDKVFGKHAINFVGGYSAQKNTNRFVGGSGDRLPSNAIRDLSQVQNLTAYGGQQTFTFASQFARLTYKFTDKYLITATVRRDGSSKFDTGHQYGVFPSVAIGWKAKEESFLRDVRFLSDLKFRASYGRVGNQSAIGLFQYLAQYSSGGPASSGTNVGYPFDKVFQGGLALTQLDNANLKWETDDQTDIGMDAAFLDGALTLTVDYYKKVSKDFLLRIATPTQTGFDHATRNVGSIDNHGFEFALNYNHSVKDIRYNIGLSLTTVNNALTKINNNTKFIDNLITLPLGANGWSTFSETNIGQPVGEFFGFQSLGIFQTQAQIDALNAKAPRGYYQGTSGQKTKPGDRYFKDVDGDGQITPSDRTSLGSPIPKFYGGLNLDVTYKAFDVNVYLYGTSGNKIFNYQARNLESFQAPGFVGIQNVSEEYYLNRWTPTNPSNRFARVTYNDDVSANNVASSVYIEDGSYLRLRNLTLGYTLPASLINKISLTRMRLYISAQNLFTITKYTGLDPEIGLPSDNSGNKNPTASGVDLGTYPSSRFYTFGFNVTF